jgi:pilus assembly protein CpaE
LLVDENREALAALNKQINFIDMVVIGEAGFGPVAYTWASQLQPDIVLVSMEEPVARALKSVEALALGQPRWPVIVVSSKGDRESLRKAMRAGANDFIAKSSDPEELRAAISSIIRRERETGASDSERRSVAHRAGTIISVFGVKGGIGKTTLATNLATSIALESQARVALVDLDLQFGDVGMVMNVSPETTITDVVRSLDKIDADLLDGFLAQHGSGVQVLPAPLSVEGSEEIIGEHIQRILDVLSAVYDYVIVDTPNSLNDTVLPALDMSTLVLLVTTPEVTCIKRTKAALDLMNHWRYSEDKVKLVINKANKQAEASPEDIASVLEYPAFWKVPFDQTAVSVFKLGGLFVQTKPASKISQNVFDLSRELLGMKKKSSFLSRAKQTLALSRR